MSDARNAEETVDLLARVLHEQSHYGETRWDECAESYIYQCRARARELLRALRALSPEDRAEAVGMVPLGVVYDAGGGCADVWVHRELESYPAVGTPVFVPYDPEETGEDA